MSEQDTPVDIRRAFDQNYLDFYDTLLTERRSDQDAATVMRLLDPKPGTRLLDLACGHGRIANRLAARGLRVTGVDITPLFLEMARRDAIAQDLPASYIRGDMRSLPFTEQFDLVVSWFTAFGYFDDDDNRQTLREVCRVLKPGGVFLIDLNNRDFVMKWFRSESLATRSGEYLFDYSEYDALTGRVNTERTFVRGETRHVVRYFIRMFSYTELRDWLLQAGFSHVGGFGDDGTPFTRTSRRMIVRARK